MRPFSRSIAVALIACLLAVSATACDRDAGEITGPGAASPPSTPPPSTPTTAAAPNEVMAFLLEALTGHGLSARIDGDEIVIDGSPVRLAGEVSSDREPQSGSGVQIAVALRLPDGRYIVQPVVGMGDDRAASIAHAQASFLLGTFHAWMAAFIDPAEDHVDRQPMLIAGRRRILTLGGTVMKSAGTTQPTDDGRWKAQFLSELQQSDLSPGVHWVDLYHGRIEQKDFIEIQLDNQRWTAMEEKLATAPWPDNGFYTSVRLFLVIQDAEGDPTRPTRRPTTLSLPATRPHPSTNAAPHDH